jgi:hypothetical protein
MSGLKARIIKLERSIPTGLAAELRALTDDEITARIAELCGVMVEEVRVWTPEEYRRLQHEIRAAMTEGLADDLLKQRPRLC